MRLGELLRAAGREGGGDAAVTGFAIDHRKVAPGTVFGAFQGASVNGEDFIPAAIAAGAIAVVARPEAQVEGALHIADANPRRAFARLAAGFFAPYPATIVAVTGTNGKTSTVEMTRQIWRMAPRRWWRQSPFLPIPPESYLEFRMVTQYGGGHGQPLASASADDVVDYLRWCRQWNRTQKRQQRLR